MPRNRSPPLRVDDAQWAVPGLASLSNSMRFDGASGEQRCWNHKMRNVLDRLPQREQSEAKELLRTVVYASTRAAALKARQAFGKRYGP